MREGHGTANPRTLTLHPEAVSRHVSYGREFSDLCHVIVTRVRCRDGTNFITVVQSCTDFCFTNCQTLPSSLKTKILKEKFDLYECP